MARDQEAYTTRRSFCWTFVGVLVAPRVAIAQGSTAIRRVGLLDVRSHDAPADLGELAEPLRKLGWVEGRNLRVERRSARSLRELPALAEELVRAKVDIILTDGPNPTLAAMRATTTIPIVFLGASDPVLSGLVASLSRPGGNVTGVSAAQPEIYAKLVSLLKDLLPVLRRVGMLEISGNPQYRLLRGRFEDSCRSLDLEPNFLEIGAASEIEGAIERLTRQHVEALVLRDDSFVIAHGAEIIGAALKRGLPTVLSDSNFVRNAGALASYSGVETERTGQVAYYVDRILRGTKPAELPVQQPTQFELAINLKTAKTLGITIPQSLLLRANEVIQ